MKFIELPSGEYVNANNISIIEEKDNAVYITMQDGTVISCKNITANDILNKINNTLYD